MRRKGFWSIAVAAALGAAAMTRGDSASAQPPLPQVPAASQQVDDLRERIEKLEKQNQELLKALQSSPALRPQAPISIEGGTEAVSQQADKETVQQIIDNAFKKRDEEAKKLEAMKKAEAETSGLTVGKDLSMRTYWNHGLWAETADKAFKVHVGGRVQFDTIWYDAESSLTSGPGGIGRVDDGFAFRRGRLEVDGTLYEVIDFFCEFDFVNTFNADPTVAANRNNVANTPVPTDLWAQVTNIPLINVVRVGNQKPPISMEHLTSSRFLPFLERSYAFDSWVGGLDNGFRPGIQLINWSENERITWAIGAFKTNQTINGWNVGDGEYDVTGRITMLPVYEHEGRCLIHLGLGASHQGVDEGAYRVRARTLLRNGPAALHTALTNVVVGADVRDMVVPEFAMQFGAFHMQAEYFANWLQDTKSPNNNNPASQQGTTFFQNAYVQAGLFLTPGDRFTYNTKGGSGAAFGRVVPQRPYFFVKGDGDGESRNLFSSGAWQVLARYSWGDYDDKAVQGGQLHDITLGLNWFLNPNIKFQWNYSAGYRDTINNQGEGWAHGFGIRMAYDF